MVPASGMMQKGTTSVRKADVLEVILERARRAGVAGKNGGARASAIGASEEQEAGEGPAAQRRQKARGVRHPHKEGEWTHTV